MRETIEVLGVAIDVVTGEEAVRRALVLWESPGCHQIVTANPELIMASLASSEQGERLRRALDASSMVVADGIGVVWASRVMGTPLPERVPGVELAEALIVEAARRGKRLFLLGGRPGVASEAAGRLEKRLPGLMLAGVHHGYFGPEEEEERVVEAIARSEVDLLLVGMGAPKQELWIDHHKERLGAKLAIGVGGTIDILAGRVERAPEVWRNLGMEWAYRLLREPKRAARMTALPRFAAAVIWQRARGRGSAR